MDFTHPHYFMQMKLWDHYKPGRPRPPGWKRALLVIIFLLFWLAIAKSARAEEADKVAHFGLNYAVVTVGYGVFKKLFHVNEIPEMKVPALLFPVFVTGTISYLKEFTNAAEGRSLDTGDLAANGLGVGAAVSAILIFDF